MSTQRRETEPDVENRASWAELTQETPGACILVRTTTRPKVLVGYFLCADRRQLILRTRLPLAYTKVEGGTPYDRRLNRRHFVYYRRQRGLWQHAIELANREHSYLDWRDPDSETMPELVGFTDRSFVELLKVGVPSEEWRGVAQEQLDGRVKVLTADGTEVVDDLDLETPDERIQQDIGPRKPGRWPIDRLVDSINSEAYKDDVNRQRKAR